MFCQIGFWTRLAKSPAVKHEIYGQYSMSECQASDPKGLGVFIKPMGSPELPDESRALWNEGTNCMKQTDTHTVTDRDRKRHMGRERDESKKQTEPCRQTFTQNKSIKHNY